ncbi:Fc receptor-like protein 5-like [Arapaima gigas]
MACASLSLVLVFIFAENQAQGSLKLLITITPKWGIYEEDSVILKCQNIASSKVWSYYWYKLVQYKSGLDHVKHNSKIYSVELLPDSSRGAGGLYMLSSVALSHTGGYVCRAGRGRPLSYTFYSEPVTLFVAERPKAVLTLQSDWTQIFSGNTVTLRCEVQGGFTEWSYNWYKDNVPKPFYSSSQKDRYNIVHAEVSHSGDYTCRGVRSSNPHYSKPSSTVRLTVSEKPRPTLTTSPQEMLYEGDTVTLRCQFTSSYRDWRYHFYKLVEYRTDLDCVRYNSEVYSAELLSDSRSGAGDSYTISAAAPTHTAGYVCRAERGNPIYYTKNSNPIQIQVTVLFTSPTLSVAPPGEVLVGQAVTLSCETQVTPKRPSTQLQYTFTKSSEVLRKAAATNQFTFIVERGDNGSYSCEAVGKRVNKLSNTVKLTLKDSFKIPSMGLTLLGSCLAAIPYMVVSIVLCVRCCRS